MSQLSPRTPERLTLSYPPPQSLSPTAKAAARHLHYSPAAGALSPRHHQPSHHISLQPLQPHRRAFLRRPSTYIQLCLLLVVTLCFHSLWVGKSLWLGQHPEGDLSRSAEQASRERHDYAQPRHLRATDKVRRLPLRLVPVCYHDGLVKKRPVKEAFPGAQQSSGASCSVDQE